jgi:hypothetical protein
VRYKSLAVCGDTGTMPVCTRRCGDVVVADVVADFPDAYVGVDVGWQDDPAPQCAGCGATVHVVDDPL